MDSLGISDELKDKLEDVLIPEQQFTLGRMLGKGMWVSVGVGMSGVALAGCLWLHFTLRQLLTGYTYRLLSLGCLGNGGAEESLPAYFALLQMREPPPMAPVSNDFMSL